MWCCRRGAVWINSSKKILEIDQHGSMEKEKPYQVVLRQLNIYNRSKTEKTYTSCKKCKM
jgi:hypothetical protein